MKVVGLIPYWLGYGEKQGGGSNLKKLGGKYLINYSLNLLAGCPDVNQVCVYCSNKNILDYFEPGLAFDLVDRPSSLDSIDASIEDVIDAFLRESDADLVVLLHPNSPFLRKSSLIECINKVASGMNDSAFTAFEARKLAWFKGAPLNYSQEQATPKLSEIEPVILEQSALYVFSADAFRGNRRRIGSNPHVQVVNAFEGHGIVTEEDFEIAQLIVNSGMYSER